MAKVLFPLLNNNTAANISAPDAKSIIIAIGKKQSKPLKTDVCIMDPLLLYPLSLSKILKNSGFIGASNSTYSLVAGCMKPMVFACNT